MVSDASSIQEKKIVLTFGTFDRLHLGHQYYLSQAREYGDVVVTIVARDSTVLRVKGKLPRYDEQTRLRNLQAMNWSDEVVLGRESGFDRCLEYYKPDVICMGYDQGDVSGKLDTSPPTPLLSERGEYKIIRLPSYMPEKWKSSLLQ